MSTAIVPSVSKTQTKVSNKRRRNRKGLNKKQRKGVRVNDKKPVKSQQNDLHNNIRLWLKGKETDPSARYSAKLVKSISTIYPTLDSKTATDFNTTLLDRAFNREIKVQPDLSLESIYGWATGFVSYAYRSGYWQAESANPQNAARAWNFIVQQLVAAANNRISSDTTRSSMPLAFRDVIALLLPKKDMNYPQGKISYSWNPPTAPSPLTSFNYPVSNALTGAQYRMWELSGANDADGYALMQDIMGFSYTPESGAAAFNDMAGFLAIGVQDTPYSGVKLVPARFESSPLFRSASAFSSNSLVIGDGDVGGGFNTLVSSELPRIEHPLASVWTIGTATNINRRAYNSHHPSGGDSNYFVYRQILDTSSSSYRNKMYPVFKPIDFYEILHRYALVVVDVFQKAANDKSFTLQYTNLGMTAMDFVIMMYQQLMCFFSDTQWGIQSILPYRNGSGSTLFTPFIVDSCCTTSANTELIKLPKYMIMNLQALGARNICSTINPAKGTEVKYNVRHYLPLFGQYQDSYFDPKAYSYNGEGGPVSIFTGAGSGYDLYNKTINGKVVDMGSSPIIFKNVATHNQIMSTMSAYIQGYSTIAKEPGADIFEVIGETLVIQEVEAKKVKSRVVVLDSKEKQKKSDKVTITVTNKMVVAASSQKPVLNEIKSVTQNFVRPEILLYVPSGGVSGSIYGETWRVYTHEAFYAHGGAQSSSSNDLMDLDIIRRGFVAECTKQRNGEETLAIKISDHFDITGNGGLLDTVASISQSVLKNFVQLAPVAASMMI